MSTSSIFVRVTIPLAVAISLSLTANIYAVRVVGSVSGEVSDLFQKGDAAVPDGVDVGDPFSASFSYESDAFAEDCEYGCGRWAVYGDGLNLQMSFFIDSQSDGVYVWRGEAPDGNVVVWDERSIGGGPSDGAIFDRLSYGPRSSSASFTSFPNSLPDPYSKSIGLGMHALGGGPFTTSTSLPVSNADLNPDVATGSADISMNAGTSAYSIGVDLDLSTFTLAPVPEPTTATLALAATFYYFGRRRGH